MEMIFQAKVKPERLMSTATIKEKQQLQPQPTAEEEKNKIAAKVNQGQAALPAIITVLLLIPLLLVISIGVFICWRKNSMFDNKAHICYLYAEQGSVVAHQILEQNLDRAEVNYWEEG